MIHRILEDMITPLLGSLRNVFISWYPSKKPFHSCHAPLGNINQPAPNGYGMERGFVRRNTTRTTFSIAAS